MNGANSLGPKVQKPGDWRVWRDKLYECQKEKEALERQILESEWKPKHIWRSIWRYWFGGKHDGILYPGKLITIYRHSNGGAIYMFSGKFSFSKYKEKDGKVAWGIHRENHDHLFLFFERPFRWSTTKIDKDAPSCG